MRVTGRALALAALALATAARAQEPQQPQQQQQPPQPEVVEEPAPVGERPSVGYSYAVDSLNNREGTTVQLEVAVDTANKRANATFANAHGFDTILIRNDIGKACLLSPLDMGAGDSGLVADRRQCTCYTIKGEAGLPLPEPVTNASFRSFEPLGTETFAGRQANRVRLSVVTTKRVADAGALAGTDLTDSLDVTALLDVETGLPLAVSFYSEPSGGGKQGQQPQAGRVESYRDVRLGGPVDPGLFEVPNYCLAAPEDEADEVLQVLLNRYRYKPFAATVVHAPMASEDDGSSGGKPGAAAATTTTASLAGTAAAQQQQRGGGGSGEQQQDEAQQVGADMVDPVLANIDMIKAHNSRPGVRYALAPNRFVHVRAEEYFQRHAVRAPSSEDEIAEMARYTVYQPGAPFLDASALATVDRRAEGKVTPVRDQGTCLSSWAEAAASAVETAVAAAGGALERRSVQRLLDCVAPGEGAAVACKGCQGGWPLTALGHVLAQEKGLLAVEEEYPYFEVTGACPVAAAAAQVARRNSSTAATAGAAAAEAEAVGVPLFVVEDVALVPRGNEDLLASAVAEHGAVVVTVQVVDDLLFYAGGVYANEGCVGRSLDHHLTIVGFTEEAWIAKSSWGTQWGEGGYIRLARGQNMCGLADWAVVPIVGAAAAGGGVR